VLAKCGNEEQIDADTDTDTIDDTDTSFFFGGRELRDRQFGILLLANCIQNCLGHRRRRRRCRFYSLSMSLSLFFCLLSFPF